MSLRDLARLFLKNFIQLLSNLGVKVLGSSANESNWEGRILVIFGGGIGDVVKRSVICGYLKRYLRGRDVYYLMPYRIKLPYAKETIYFDHRKAKVDPVYYFKIVNDLRKIGFQRIVVMLPFWDGFLPSLAADIAPKTIFCTRESTPNSAYRAVGEMLSRVRHRSFKKMFRFVDVASEYDRDRSAKYPPSDVWKHVYFISQVLCDIDPRNKADLSEEGPLRLENTRTEIESGSEKAAATEGLGAYCVIGLGSSYSGKDWQAAKFGEVAEFLSKKGFAIVLVGGPESVKLVEDFEGSYQGEKVNLINKTNLNELCSVIKGSSLVIGNDTSFIHIAIAFKRPTICVGYNTSGVDTNYGYQDINTWILSKNILETSVATVIGAAEKITAYIKTNPDFPREGFKTSFFNNKIDI